MYVQGHRQHPSGYAPHKAAPARYLVVRHHPLLLARLAWRPAVALLVATGVTLSRAMALNPLNEGVATLLTVVAVGLFAAGGLSGAWTYLDWSCSTLVVGSGRLIVRGGVPGIRRYQRELLLTRVSRVDVRWPVLSPRAWRCGDLVIGIMGAAEIRFPLAAEAGAARNALLNLSCAGPPSVAGRDLAKVAIDSTVMVQPARALAARFTNHDGRATSTSGPGLFVGRSGRSIAPRVWRRHVWWPLRRSLWPAALAGVGFATLPIVWPAGDAASALEARLAGPAPIVVATVWLLAVWLVWWRDRLLVQDGRLIYRSGTPWAKGARDTVVLLAVADDFALRVTSPLGHLLDYGDIAVGTAGAWPFVYRCARHPDALIRALREASVVAQVERETPVYRLLGSDVAPTASWDRRERTRGGRCRRLTWPRSFTRRRARDRA